MSSNPEVFGKGIYIRMSYSLQCKIFVNSYSSTEAWHWQDRVKAGKALSREEREMLSAAFKVGALQPSQPSDLDSEL